MSSTFSKPASRAASLVAALCGSSNSAGTEITACVIITARTGEGEISNLIVPNGTRGYEISQPMEKLGWHASDTRELSFRDCAVPAGNLLGPRGEGFRQFLEILDGGRISVAAMGVGLAQGAYDLAYAYAKERQQFGKPISEFQAIQFKLADMATQIDAVIEDIGAHALKTGMLANSRIIEIVAEKVREHKLKNLVVDPVMVAKSGDRLLRKDAIDALRSKLIPLATVVTPNLPEAEELTGLKLNRAREIREAARRTLAMGARSVVIKGGHRRGPAIDLFFDGKKFRELRSPRIRSRHTHGTGCTFSAAIAAYLARGERVETAVLLAKKYITEAIRSGFAVGAGQSPVHHFYDWWDRKK